MRLTSFVVVIAAAILVPPTRPAAAQTPIVAVPEGTRIYVSLASGGEPVAGSLLTLSADSLDLLVDDRARAIQLAQVAKIQRLGDPDSDGAAKGALIVGLWCFLVCGQGTNSSGQLLGAVAVNSTVGSLIGRAIDRGHVGRTTIYTKRHGWQLDAATRSSRPLTNPGAASSPAAY